MCKVLNISRKTYYKYRNTIDKDYQSYLEIKEVFEEGYETYGYRRIKKALELKTGIIMNHKKILRIMKKYDLKVKYIRVFRRKPMTYSVKENVKPNLLNKNFKAEKCNQKWSTDITFLQHKNKTAYLSCIIDLYTKKIISYKISYKATNSLVTGTLNEAIKKCLNPQGIIIHSDQGYQYTSYEYKRICESNGILISMSRKATPEDNAPIESFFANLKRETLYSYDIKSLKHYINIVKNWIEFYNTNRVSLNHSRGYKLCVY